MYHFNISPNSTCIIMNTYIIIQLCMVMYYNEYIHNHTIMYGDVL